MNGTLEYGHPHHCECGNVYYDVDGPCCFKCVVCGNPVRYDDCTDKMYDLEFCESCVTELEKDEDDDLYELAQELCYRPYLQKHGILNETQL